MEQRILYITRKDDQDEPIVYHLATRERSAIMLRAVVGTVAPPSGIPVNILSTPLGLQRLVLSCTLLYPQSRSDAGFMFVQLHGNKRNSFSQIRNKFINVWASFMKHNGYIDGYRLCHALNGSIEMNFNGTLLWHSQ